MPAQTVRPPGSSLKLAYLALPDSGFGHFSESAVERLRLSGFFSSDVQLGRCQDVTVNPPDDGGIVSGNST